MAHGRPQKSRGPRSRGLRQESKAGENAKGPVAVSAKTATGPVGRTSGVRRTRVANAGRVRR